MKSFFQNRKLGFWLTLIAACLAILGSIAYLLVYAISADPLTGEWDRVFNWLTFGLLLGGGVVALGGELLRLRFVPIVSMAMYGIAFAQHAVETAYPMADAITGVPFFGGSIVLATIFSTVFSWITIIHLVACFMEHNKENESGGKTK